MSSNASNVHCVKMPDGEIVETVLIHSPEEFTAHFPEFWSVAHKDVPVVGFDTEWMFCSSLSKNKRAKIALLKLCSVSKEKKSCLLINLEMYRMPPSLIEFLSLKEIKFVGINIAKDLQKLEEDHGIQIRNAVELNSIAAEAWADFTTVPHPDSLNMTNPSVPAAWCIPLGGINLLLQVICKTKVQQEVPFWLIDTTYVGGVWTFSGYNGTDYDLLRYSTYSTFSVYAAVKIAQTLFEKGRFGFLDECRIM